jgi:hypothetical protein
MVIEQTSRPYFHQSWKKKKKKNVSSSACAQATIQYVANKNPISQRNTEQLEALKQTSPFLFFVFFSRNEKKKRKKKKSLVQLKRSTTTSKRLQD